MFIYKQEEYPQGSENTSLDFTALLLPCALFVNLSCLLGSSSFCALLPAVFYLKVS